jgi:AmiR/NasT family two-component response regulator
MSTAPELNADAPDVGAAPTRTLLLVDDDRLVLATLTCGLEAAGFVVVAAESVNEAEDLLAGGTRPDLAIVDVMMPERSGLELAQRLQELDHIPFILLTATADAHVVEQATQNGALGYMVKPVDVPQLVPAIEAALARSSDLKDFRMTQRQLQEALDADRDINVAIGIVMVKSQLGRSAAFDQLRKTARVRRLKLSALASELIAGAVT